MTTNDDRLGTWITDLEAEARGLNTLIQVGTPAQKNTARQKLARYTDLIETLRAAQGVVEELEWLRAERNAALERVRGLEVALSGVVGALDDGYILHKRENAYRLLGVFRTARAALAQPAAPAPAEAEADRAVMNADWEELGRAVHRSWRDGMLRQGRTVERERLAWETLPERDRVLDRYIAGEVVAALLAAQAQAGGEATPTPEPTTVCRLCGGTGELHWLGCVALAGGEG